MDAAIEEASRFVEVLQATTPPSKPRRILEAGWPKPRTIRVHLDEHCDPAIVVLSVLIRSSHA